jgi:hypothetical protein
MRLTAALLITRAFLAALAKVGEHLRVRIDA